MPIYASPEQFMRDRSDYARKGIARGRSVVVTIFSGGVLFVAENPSPTLHKVSEIYDRIGFAATGRYNEYENLRTAGIRLADVRGFSYDRRDVNSRWLANAYAQTLGSVFSENSKPLEVELCVAEVGWPDGPSDGSADQLYRISYDGSLFDEPRFVVMGGVTEPISAALDASFTDGWDLATALRACVGALGTGPDGSPRELPAENIEVAVLDRRLLGRTFRRVEGHELDALLSDGRAPGPTDGAGPAAGNGDGDGDGAAVPEADREPNIATTAAEPEQAAPAQDPPVDPDRPDQRGEEKAGDEPAGTGE